MGKLDKVTQLTHLGGAMCLIIAFIVILMVSLSFGICSFMGVGPPGMMRLKWNIMTTNCRSLFPGLVEW